MVSLVERLMPILASWGLWIAAGLLALSLLGFWRLSRRRPASWPVRLGRVFLICVALVAVLGFWALLGPLAGQMADIRDVYGKVGRKAPDLAFRQVADDAPRRLSELRGRVVLLNLWATWCPPCREEMPALDRLQKEYEDEGLVVVTVSDEDREQLRKYAEEHPLSTLYVYDPAIAKEIGFAGRPLTLLIDRDGTVREAVIGTRTYEAFEEKVRGLLG